MTVLCSKRAVEIIHSTHFLDVFPSARRNGSSHSSFRRPVRPFRQLLEQHLVDAAKKEKSEGRNTFGRLCRCCRRRRRPGPPAPLSPHRVGKRRAAAAPRPPPSRDAGDCLVATPSAASASASATTSFLFGAQVVRPTPTPESRRRLRRGRPRATSPPLESPEIGGEERRRRRRRRRRRPENAAPPSSRVGSSRSLRRRRIDAGCAIPYPPHSSYTVCNAEA